MKLASRHRKRLRCHWERHGKRAHDVIHSIRMARVWNTYMPNPIKDRNSCLLLLPRKSCSAILEDGLALRVKPNILLPHNPAIIPLGIYSVELKRYVQNTCVRMFITTSVIAVINIVATEISFRAGWTVKELDNGTLLSTVRNGLSSQEKNGKGL